MDEPVAPPERELRRQDVLHRIGIDDRLIVAVAQDVRVGGAVFRQVDALNIPMDGHIAHGLSKEFVIEWPAQPVVFETQESISI